MNRQMMMTGATFVVSLVVALGLLWLGGRVSGAALKIVIAVVVGVVFGVVAFVLTRDMAKTS